MESSLNTELSSSADCAVSSHTTSSTVALQQALENLTLEVLSDNWAPAVSQVSATNNNNHNINNSTAFTSSSAKSSSTDDRQRKKRTLSQLQQLFVLMENCYARAVDADLLHSEMSRCTERDLYYMHPRVYPSQVHLRNTIRALCDAMNDGRGGRMVLPQQEEYSPPRYCSRETWARSSLGIDATAKSLLVGASVSIVLRRRVDVDGATSFSEASTVVDLGRLGPSGLAIGAAFVEAVSSILLAPCRASPGGCTTSPINAQCPLLLVVEKESTLRHLLTVDRLWERVPHWIFVCTKGFPCYASRSFLRLFTRLHPTIPVCVLCDGDVFGVHIAWCLCRTEADDRGWYLKMSSRSSSSSSSSMKPKTLTPPSVLSSYRDQWCSFVQFLGSFRFVGLTSDQMGSLSIPPSALSIMSKSEVHRAQKLRTELHKVQGLIADSMSTLCYVSPDTADSGGERCPPELHYNHHIIDAALRTVRQLIEAVDGLVLHRRKAELQSLAHHPSGIVGALGLLV